MIFCKFAAMRKSLLLALFLCMYIVDIHAQKIVDRLKQDTVIVADTVGHKPEIGSKPVLNLDSLQMYSWTVSPRLGEMTIVLPDSNYTNFHRTTLVEGKSVAMGYLGNIGSPAQSKIFFDRAEPSRFSFLDAYSYIRKYPQDNLFRNTKKPYSNITYQSGGSGQKNEARFMGELSSNFGKKLNVGFNFDYLYARGFYTSLYNKQVNYDFYASYIGERYKMNAFASNNYYKNSENGGVADDTYITDPNSEANKEAGFTGESLDIPVNLTNTLNAMSGRNIYITNKYDLGDYTEEYMVNDSTRGTKKKVNYIAPASVIFTTNYTDQKRRLKTTSTEADTYFAPYYKNNLPTDTLAYNQRMNDLMSYYSFKNTLALSMNEGFRSWTKFGLTIFGEYDMRKYSIPEGTFQGQNRREGQSSFNIGAVLSKEKGRYLKYKFAAEKNILDSDYRLSGEITTMINLKGKELYVKGQAYIKDIKPTFFEENFYSKYRSWSFSFNDIRRTYIGGEIYIPHTKTRINGGVENIQNYIYYNSSKLITQNSGSVQVVALRLDQNLQAGVFHWDNQIVYQTSTQEEVLPLPKLSLYTNIYLLTKVAKVLTFQLGIDAYYHTKYYAPGYDPLTIQFYNQKEVEIGNFPIASAYANLHLKNTKFFIMMYNLAEGMGDSNYFSLPHYPVNPRILKLGLSWNFSN